MASNDQAIHHCKHFVIRKKRFCRMTVKPGQEYCGEHKPFVSNLQDSNGKTNSEIRIACPLDNKHTCFSNKLEAHLKVCNARQDNLPHYIVPGINLCSFDHDFQSNKNYAKNTSERQLSSVCESEIVQVITLVNQFYKYKVEGKIKDRHLEHKLLTEELAQPEYGNKTKKHLIQTSSLISYLNDFTLSNSTCFVEFGAGKGQVSYWLAKTLDPFPGRSVLLVDRASHRHKKENKLKIDATKCEIKRIRADIADLDLKQVDVIQNSINMVGLSKHLCGVATDLALRCLSNADDGFKLQGFIMAFCCHHRCLWDTYTGRTVLEDFGINGHMFDIMCGMVSWATCGTGKSRESKKTITETLPNQSIQKECFTDSFMSFTEQDKAEIGRKCKLVIDYGRLKFFEDLGFSCQLYYYVDRIISPENVCLVAHRF